MKNNRNEQAKISSQKIFNLFTSANYNLAITHCKKNIKKFPEYLIFYNLQSKSKLYTKISGQIMQRLKMQPTKVFQYQLGFVLTENHHMVQE